MNARDEILARVRDALRDADTTEVPVPRGYRSAAPPDDLVGLFCDRVADYRAVVTRCAPDEVADRVRDALGRAARVLLAPDLSYDVADAAPDQGESALDLDRVDAVVTEASVGIAETGTIVLTHGAGQGRRALSLVPDLHVCVVRADQIVPGVPDAVAALDPERPQTWISGPSATSDIELDRVEGVHGPRNLHVVVAG
ncbi:MAG TPA: lactate utilization protein C [Nocardioidaceae bacterium]